MHGFYTTVWVNNPVSQQRGSDFSCCGTCTNSNASSPVQKAHLQKQGASAPVTCPGPPSHQWVAACCASVTLLTQDDRALGVVSCSPSGGEGCRDSAFSAPDGLAPHSLRDLDKSIKTCFFTIKHSSHQFGQWTERLFPLLRDFWTGYCCYDWRFYNFFS